MICDGIDGLASDIIAKSRDIWWFHSIDLGDGNWTNGHKSREHMEQELTTWQFPADLDGKSVLDIGCADGGWSVAALRRGAASVTAIDEQITTGLQFLLDHKVFPIEFQQIDLFSNTFMALPVFDVVIFAGVLYHVQDPLEALKRVRSHVREQVVFETHINEAFGNDSPMMVFYENDELANDPTNWWGPNTACLEGMFRTAGFSFEHTHTNFENARRANGRTSYILRPDDGSIYAKVSGSATGSNSVLEEYRQTIDRLREEVAELKAKR